MLPAPPVKHLDKDSPVVAPRDPTTHGSVEDITSSDRQPRNFVASCNPRVPYTSATGLEPLQTIDASRQSDYRQAQDLMQEPVADAGMLANMDLPTDFGFDPLDPFFTGYGLDCTFTPFVEQPR